jgi:hypothetical protein
MIWSWVVRAIFFSRFELSKDSLAGLDIPAPIAFQCPDVLFP